MSRKPKKSIIDRLWNIIELDRSLFLILVSIITIDVLINKCSPEKERENKKLYKQFIKDTEK